jgi:hypothetical protein
MARSIEDRAKDSFGNDDRESVSKYLDWVRTTLIDYAQNNRRMATLLLIVVAIFELVAYSRNSKIIIGSFVVERSSVVLDFLPTLVAYLFFQIAADANKADRLRKLFSEVFKIWSVEAEKNDLDVSLMGPAPLYWNPTGGTTRESNTYSSDRAEEFGSMAMMIVILIGVLAFEVQAYCVLFAPSGSKLVLWIIGLIVTLFCLTLGFMVLMGDSDTSHPPAKPDTKEAAVGAGS